MAFDVDDCLALLLDRREEEFRHERLLRLFQFQTWIWFPGKRGIAARDAGRLAAAAILRKMELEHSWRGWDRMGGSRQITLKKLQTLSQSDEYRQIFDAFISSGGGWSVLLFDTPGPAEFDLRIKQRTDRAAIVADLIEYRLRAALYLLEGSDRSRITHAIFFKWWSNRKTLTARTAFARWKNLNRSAIFIFLTLRRPVALNMKPPSADSSDFAERLLHSEISASNLHKLLSEYAFVHGVLCDDNFYDLPMIVAPTRFELPPFSNDEFLGRRSENRQRRSRGRKAKRSLSVCERPDLARDHAWAYERVENTHLQEHGDGAVLQHRLRTRRPHRLDENGDEVA